MYWPIGSVNGVNGTFHDFWPATSTPVLHASFVCHGYNAIMHIIWLLFTTSFILQSQYKFNQILITVKLTARNFLVITASYLTIWACSARPADKPIVVHDKQKTLSASLLLLFSGNMIQITHFAQFCSKCV